MKINVRNGSVIYFILIVFVLGLSYSGAAVSQEKFQSLFADVNGVKIHYLKAGTGPKPLVLIHGFGDTSHMWIPLFDDFGKDYTIIAPDMRGLGDSSKPATGYDKKTVASDIHELVKSLGYEKIDLVGHDIGLMVAYSYAAQYPNEVERLALLEAPIPGIGEIWDKVYTTPALWHFHFVNSPIALDLVKGRERLFLEHFWQTLSPHPETFSEADRKIYAASYAQDGAMRAAFEMFKTFNTQDAEDNRKFSATKLTMPVLTIEGDKAMGGALEIQAKLVADHVTSVMFTDTGHWLMEQRPTETKAELMKFFSNESAMKEMRETPVEVQKSSDNGNKIGSSGLPGVHTTVLYGDPSKAGYYSILLFVPANTTIQAHSHRDDRVATVVAGEWHFGYGTHFDPKALKTLPPGSVYSEPGGRDHNHFAQTTASAVVVQISGFGPTDTIYFDSANDPNAKKK